MAEERKKCNVGVAHTGRVCAATFTPPSILCEPIRAYCTREYKHKGKHHAHDINGNCVEVW